MFNNHFVIRDGVNLRLALAASSCSGLGSPVLGRVHLVSDQLFLPWLWNGVGMHLKIGDRCWLHSQNPGSGWSLRDILDRVQFDLYFFPKTIKRIVKVRKKVSTKLTPNTTPTPMIRLEKPTVKVNLPMISWYPRSLKEVHSFWSILPQHGIQRPCNLDEEGPMWPGEAWCWSSEPFQRVRWRYNKRATRSLPCRQRASPKYGVESCTMSVRHWCASTSCQWTRSSEVPCPTWVQQPIPNWNLKKVRL